MSNDRPDYPLSPEVPVRVVPTVLIPVVLGAGIVLSMDTAAVAAPVAAAQARPAVIGHGLALRGVGAGADATAAPPPVQSAVAGYFTPVLAAKQKVTGMLRVPTVTCGSGKSADYLVVGLGSTSSGEFLGGLVQITCSRGTATYQAAAYTGSAVVSSKLTVAPRDSLMIVVTAGAHPVATITDKTARTSVTGGSAAFTADTGQFTAQAAGASFPEFARTGFTAVNSSGKGLNARTATRYDQYDAGQPVLVTSAIKNGAFTITPA